MRHARLEAGRADNVCKFIRPKVARVLSVRPSTENLTQRPVDAVTAPAEAHQRRGDLR